MLVGVAAGEGLNADNASDGKHGSDNEGDCPSVALQNPIRLFAVLFVRHRIAPLLQFPAGVSGPFTLQI
jgi:hypothetical protein